MEKRTKKVIKQIFSDVPKEIVKKKDIKKHNKNTNLHI